MDVLDKGGNRQQKSVRTLPLCNAERSEASAFGFFEFFGTEKERQKQILRRYAPQNDTFLRLENAMRTFVAQQPIASRLNL
jgi:hypothetical protein